jgi:hypothetical protein
MEGTADSEIVNQSGSERIRERQFDRLPINRIYGSPKLWASRIRWPVRRLASPYATCDCKRVQSTEGELRRSSDSGANSNQTKPLALFPESCAGKRPLSCRFLKKTGSIGHVVPDSAGRVYFANLLYSPRHHFIHPDRNLASRVAALCSNSLTFVSPNTA